MAKTYKLGVGEKPLRDGNAPGWGYPYEIEFDCSRPDAPFLVTEGRGVVSGGGWFNAKDLLHASFRENLEHTQLEWMIPLLRRIAAGEFADPAAVEGAVLAAYREHTGCDPKIY
jgi:hypothetical protein